MKHLFLGALVIILSYSCGGSNIDQASESLIGMWEIDEIYSAYGEKFANGTAIDFDTTEMISEGWFEFLEDGTSNYSFTRLDTLFSNEDQNWTLTRSQINCGFNNCDRYDLELDDFSFVCQYGDETNDAHINAMDIVLFEETPDVGPFQTIRLKLTKE